MKQNGSFLITLVLAIAGGAVIGMALFGATASKVPPPAPGPVAGAPKPSPADTASTGSASAPSDSGTSQPVTSNFGTGESFGAESSSIPAQPADIDVPPPLDDGNLPKPR